MSPTFVPGPKERVEIDGSGGRTWCTDCSQHQPLEPAPGFEASHAKIEEQEGTDLWRTVIRLEVLSRGRLPDMELHELAEAVTTGDCSGSAHDATEQEVSAACMRRLLIAQGSDPEFLLDGDDDG